jgi:cysteinyl-tRNA synthetase
MELKPHALSITNSMSRRKELFEPLKPGYVGLYVCGPTVYGEPHLGHARPAIAFDVLFRYLQHLGYKVRYIRNITDVGHLENDADEGEDKIARKARLEELEPMEVAQHYTNLYHEAMHSLNVMDPSIEPHASGHIIEQIEFVKRILEAGFAYESNGSIYFDVNKYHREHTYGRLSGKVLEDLLAFTRELDGQSEKRHSFDFALWKKAQPGHIMRWPSPWGDGYPGWHMECSAMSKKYLGTTFDIHGGGMDLQFPHHDCEIAQSVAANGQQPVRYWMHNNMVTINGQKMGKSLGNAVSLREFFSGNHPLLEQAYGPMTIRFFMLQAHYGSTVDFSNAALQGSEKGMQRLFAALKTLDKLSASASGGIDASRIEKACYEAMDDDLNTPLVIAALFDAARMINQVAAGQASIDDQNLITLKHCFQTFFFDILGMKEETDDVKHDSLLDPVMRLVIDLRQDARSRKDFGTADKIREALGNIKISIKDSRDGSTWEVNN